MRQTGDLKIFDVKVDGKRGEFCEYGRHSFARAKRVGRVEADPDSVGPGFLDDRTERLRGEAIVVLDAQPHAVEPRRDAAKGFQDLGGSRPKIGSVDHEADELRTDATGQRNHLGRVIHRESTRAQLNTHRLIGRPFREAVQPICRQTQ